jgi:uncharacterized OB-fold protein
VTAAAPTSTPETAMYWQAADRGELQLPYCGGCAKYFFYPRSFCPSCYSTDIEWRRVSGAATLVSYVVNRRPLPPAPADQPQVIAVVELAEGPRLLANIIGIQPSSETLPLDAPLTVAFELRGDQAVPVFTTTVPA